MTNKTINLLNTMPEYQVENIYSFARFLSTQNEDKNTLKEESIDDIPDSLLGVISDDGMTLKDYKEERIKERYRFTD